VRILVVDDDAVFREELAELLRDDGHAVAAEPSVAKAIATLEGAAVDLVLTDLKMPRQSGLELLREVRARWPRTIVVVITGFATVDSALEAMKLGAFDYIRKPFRIEQVRATLALVGQEHEFEVPADVRRDPAAEATELSTNGRHDVLFFGEPAPAAGRHLTVAPLDPRDPAALVAAAEEFVAEHPNAAIVVAGVERFLEHHRLEDVVAALDRLRAALAGHGPLRVGFNPRRVSPAVATALGGVVASEETHATLEALANPIRRAALERLAVAPASFGELMHAAGLDDSPKMSFHLRKLIDAGLLRHDDETYRLTTRGEGSARLLRDATFLPPASDTGNLAFPGRGSGRRPAS